MSFRFHYGQDSQGEYFPPSSGYAFSQNSQPRQEMMPPLLSQSQSQSFRYDVQPQPRQVYSYAPMIRNLQLNQRRLGGGGDPRILRQQRPTPTLGARNQVGSIIASQARVEANLDQIPLKLGSMLEEGVEALKKKYSSESAQLSEELTTLKKKMDAYINHREEELGRQRELCENLMEKQKTLIKDLMQFAQKSEETQVKLTEMENTGRKQAKIIEDLKFKLAAKEKKEILKTATKVKEELGGQSARTQEKTQSFYPPLIPLFSTDDLLPFFSTDDEEEEEDMKKIEEIKVKAEPSPQSSPCSVSLLGPLAEEEREKLVELVELVELSSDSEYDTDSEVAMGEE